MWHVGYLVQAIVNFFGIVSMCPPPLSKQLPQNFLILGIFIFWDILIWLLMAYFIFWKNLIWLLMGLLYLECPNLTSNGLIIFWNVLIWLLIGFLYSGMSSFDFWWAYYSLECPNLTSNGFIIFWNVLKWCSSSSVDGATGPTPQVWALSHCCKCCQ